MLGRGIEYLIRQLNTVVLIKVFIKAEHLKHCEFCSLRFEKNTGDEKNLEEVWKNQLLGTKLSDWICNTPRNEKGEFIKFTPAKTRRYVTDEEWDLIKEIRKENINIQDNIIFMKG